MANTKQLADTSDSNVSSAEMISSWTWGKQPGRYCNVSNGLLIIGIGIYFASKAAMNGADGGRKITKTIKI